MTQLLKPYLRVFFCLGLNSGCSLSYIGYGKWHNLPLMKGSLKAAMNVSKKTVS